MKAPMAELRIRRANEADAEAVLSIYAPIVRETPISFETEIPSIEEIRRRIASALERHSFLVCAAGAEIAGYAYGGVHRARAAYRFATEVSVYVDANWRKRGVARMLYENLLAELAELGYCMAYAGITLPNDASVGFHRALGFETVGTFPRAGWKFGQWHDTGWYWRKLREHPLQTS